MEVKIQTQDMALAMTQYQAAVGEGLQAVVTHVEKFRQHMAVSGEHHTVPIVAENVTGFFRTLEHVIQLGLIPQLNLQGFSSEVIEWTQRMDPIEVSIPHTEIAFQQIKVLCEYGIPFQITDSVLRKSLKQQHAFDSEGEAESIQLNVKPASLIAQRYQEALEQGVCSQLEPDCRRDLLRNCLNFEDSDAAFEAHHQIEIRNPSLRDLKRILENGFLLKIDEPTLWALIKNLKNHPAGFTIHFTGYPEEAYRLLDLQLQQIEALNPKLNFQIQYTLDADMIEGLKKASSGSTEHRPDASKESPYVTLLKQRLKDLIFICQRDLKEHEGKIQYRILSVGLTPAEQKEVSMLKEALQNALKALDAESNDFSCLRDLTDACSHALTQFQAEKHWVKPVYQGIVIDFLLKLAPFQQRAITLGMFKKELDVRNDLDVKTKGTLGRVIN